MSEQAIFANICMVCDGDRAVVINRKKEIWPGIAFPGGHVEEGESFTDSVIREVFEECGLRISSPQLCGIKHWTHNGIRNVVLIYTTCQFEGELTSSEEGEVRWERISDLSDLPLAAGMEEIIQLINEAELSELYYYNDGSDDWSVILK